MVIFDPNTYFWPLIDNEESYTDLVMAIQHSQCYANEFSNPDRVSLFIAVCDVDQVQQETINRYTQQLSPDFRAYQVEINHQHLNVSRLVSELVEQESYLQNAGKAVVSVVGITSPSSFKLGVDSTKSDRDTFFGYLQWTQESFNDFHLPIILWVSKNIYDLMLRETPDLCSWRENVFFFKSDLNELNSQPISFDKFKESFDIYQGLTLAASGSISIEDLQQLINRMIELEGNSEDYLLTALYNRLGWLYVDRLDTGKYDNHSIEQNLAIECFQKAINLASNSTTKADTALATSLNDLAYLYESIGEYVQAEPLFVRALAIREEQLSANHPDTATSLSNLAGLYQSIGKYAEAEPLFVRALATVEQSLGTNHPNTQTIRENLEILRQQLVSRMSWWERLKGIIKQWSI